MPERNDPQINSSNAALLEMRQQIAALQLENNSQRNEKLEKRLIDLRIEAAQQLLSEPTTSEWTHPTAVALPKGPNEIPEIQFPELSAEKLASGILNHGALIIRNMLDSEQCSELRQNIDRAFASRSVQADGTHEGDEWYNMPTSVPRPAMPTGAIWTACAPRPMNNLLALFDRLGLQPIINEYLGQEALLSVKKWVLRRAEPAELFGWHQDGAFMGSNIRSANLWISLSKCGQGADAPGIDIVPTRLEKIVDTGTEDAYFDWSVSDQLVNKEFKKTPPITPLFNEGDAIFFDHFNLHRTSPGLHYSMARYAVECWFIGKENYPPKQIPMIW